MTATADGPHATVTSCHRYPVKSFQGLTVDRLRVGPAGIEGDRSHGLLDDETGRLLSAKRTAALLEASATDDTVTLPDGTSFGVADPDADRLLSGWLGRPVHLAPAGGAGPHRYEMTFDPPNDDAELFDIEAPAGSFVDLAHVHLVNAATLRGCAAARPDLDWDARRFRPNVLVDLGGEAFAEQAWIGRRIRLGDRLELAVDGPTVRCAMPLRAQPGGLGRQPGLFAAMEELNPTFPNHLGLYATVVTPGIVAVGDPVTVL